MATTRLQQLFRDRPCRGPVGTSACRLWELSIRRFKAEAKRLGLTEWEAEQQCREKSESAATLPNT